MIKLLERNIATIEERLILLAPPGQPVPGFFSRVAVDDQRHRSLVREMQGLRGAVYLADGAVQPHHLSSDGLHQTPEDAKSWHLLMLNRENHISACAWYMEHDDDISIEQLRVRSCPLNSDGHPLRERLQGAVTSELTRARVGGLRFAEVGGWAVARASRCTSEGLLLALAAYSFGRRLGGALGLTTATVRHSSSTILRRLGGALLEDRGLTVPSYFDERYGCEMELLRFDSRQPNHKYVGLIERLREKLANVPVIATPMAVAAAPTWEQPAA